MSRPSQGSQPEPPSDSGSGESIVASSPLPPPDRSGDAGNDYRAAVELVRAGKHEDAVVALRAFIARYPRHDYADNAQYWLGETFYARKSYGEAASAFRAVVERWPAGNKAPDALLKLGFTLLMMGDGQKGRAVLTQVTEHYPGTDAARLAEGRLSALKEGK